MQKLYHYYRVNTRSAVILTVLAFSSSRLKENSIRRFYFSKLNGLLHLIFLSLYFNLLPFFLFLLLLTQSKTLNCHFLYYTKNPFELKRSKSFASVRTPSFWDSPIFLIYDISFLFFFLLFCFYFHYLKGRMYSSPARFFLCYSYLPLQITVQRVSMNLTFIRSFHKPQSKEFYSSLIKQFFFILYNKRVPL
jgi:hypothetical protein